MKYRVIPDCPVTVEQYKDMKILEAMLNDETSVDVCVELARKALDERKK